MKRFELLSYFGKWCLIAAAVAALAGSASAIFLIALDHATGWRDRHVWAIWLLPIAGFGVGWVYHGFGKTVDAGNRRIIDEIRDPKQILPLRMAPLALGGTLVSHLFGASVGREGTAVQMGAALADRLTRIFRLRRADRRILLISGMSAGFSSVFGTPLAGAVFGLEVCAMGRMRYEALFPCLAASIAADRVCLAWGVHHTHYAIGAITPVGISSVAAVIAAGLLFGLAGRLFVTAVHQIGGLSRRCIGYAPLRPFVGGVLVAVAVWAFDAYRYIGLGMVGIVCSFQAPMPLWDSVGKFALTAVSLGTGFKGGEVTPLFYIGATLGNALAPLLHMPFPMMAGIGLAAVFAGAAKTPIATTLMAMELFGVQIGPLAAIGCVTAYLFSGHAGIYHARVGDHKSGRAGAIGERMAPQAGPDMPGNEKG